MRFLPLLLVAASALAGERRETPAPRETPVGGQFLSDERGWQTRLPTLTDGPPTLFLLPAAELATGRYSWQLPTLANNLLEELRDVLAVGCSDGCGQPARDVSDAIAALLANDHAWRIGRPFATRKRDEDDAGETRRFGVRVTSGRYAADVACTCYSEYFGMRIWTDTTRCTLALARDGVRLVEYAPQQTVRPGKTGLLLLEQWEQPLTFAGGAVVVTSGFDYTPGVEPQKGDVRGAIVRSGVLAP